MTIVALAITTWAGAVAPATIDAPIERVTVYGDRARVTRVATITVDRRRRVELPLLPTFTDADSVRVEASGAGVGLDTVEIEPVGAGDLSIEEARRVLAAIQMVDDQIALARFQDSLLSRVVGLGGTLPDVPTEGEAFWSNADPVRWRETLSFLRQWTERTDGRRTDVVALLEKLRRERQALVVEAASVATGNQGRLRVSVQLSGDGSARVQLSYVVVGAQWRPRYEVRLNPVSDEVTVSLLAFTEQKTGEDWIAAALTFSNAAPTTAVIPDLPRWRIGERDRFVPQAQALPQGGDSTAASPRSPGIDPDVELRETLRAKLLAAAVGAETSATEVKPSVRGASTRDSRYTVEGFQSFTAPTTVTSVSDHSAGDGGVGEIRGTVFDQTGNPIKGVKLQLRAGEGGASRVAYSNDEGSFRFPAVLYGVYQIAASAPKLRTVTQHDIEMRGGRALDVNLVMEVENARVETVTVLQKAPVVSTRGVVKEMFDINVTGGNLLASTDGPRDLIHLRPPPAYKRPALSADLASLGTGGGDSSFAAVSAETIPSATPARRVALETWRWPVAVERRLVPAVRSEAFLVASLRSPTTTVLPGGEAALFLGGQPVGKARLPLIRPGESFTLPLGTDRAVRGVRRIRLETVEKGLVWKAEINRYVVDIEVANPHKRPVSVAVLDYVPRGGDDSVKVHLEPGTPGAAVDRDRGTLSWRSTLKAGSTATFTYSYTLERPKGHRLHQ